jgi:hypothetical protein
LPANTHRKNHEVHGATNDEKKKNVAFQAQGSKEDSDDDCNGDESDEEMALFVRRFIRFMKKRNYGKKEQSSKKNPFGDKKCFDCGELDHIIINCPNKKDDKNKKDKRDDDKKKKKFLKKKRSGQAYYAEWDSDTSSNSDDDDDDKPYKGVPEISIKEAPSLFSTPHCLMAKGDAKVLQDGKLDEFSYDDLVDMLNGADEFMSKEKAKLRDLKLKFHSLQASYEELKTSHENLKETHEKLEEAHNSLLAHENKAKLSVGVDCDLISEKCYASIVTNPSCSSSDLSCLSDKSSCDKSLLVENELSKKEVICLTNDFKKML